MSFGGFGSGNTSGGFGGFGSNNNTAASSSGSLFGGNTATSGFGGSGFGASNNTGSPFGQNKPAFGAPATTTSGSSMFGGGTSTSGGFGGGGGFGATNNANTGFGASNTSAGGLFGQNKPATGGFGASNTGGGLFGSGGTTGGFGAATTQTSNAFGSTTATTNNPFGGGASTAGTGFGAGSTGFGNSFGANNTANTGSTTQGTSNTPFTPVTEKDGTGAAASNVAYQSITMQQPYANKSFEELRVEDYAQNRRLPQSSSFGSGGSTFGGFGQNNTSQPSGGLFGSNTGTSGGFGGAASNTGFGSNTGSGFGANTGGGGLFGQNKPAATGGLFGANAASSGASTGGFGATSGGTGGLFGSNNNQQQPSTGSTFGGGFGSNNNTTQSGGLFGQANQSKPAFGGFGASPANNTNTGSTGFGGFGQNNQQTQQNQTGGGLFGNNTNNAGGSLFGNTNTQNKPAGGGLFGSTTGASNTGGSLFGNNNQQANNTFGQSANNTGGSLFGNNNNNQANASGSLFGNNNQSKPAGSSLFGAPAAGGNTGGGLFGNNQQATGAGGSLFGNNNQNQQNAGGSLFGGQQNKPGLTGSLFGGGTGGNNSLFGGNNQSNTSGSLFGGNTQNQNQGGGNSLFGGNNQNQNQNAGGSLFGSQQNQPQQTHLTASLTGDPYGNVQLFSSLASPSPPVGPLATPLSGAKAPARPRASLLASVRSGSPMLSASQSLTPRTRPGYGFSYSTYNSPASGAQSLTPGAAGLLRPATSFGSSLPSKLSKSFSTSNLRGDLGESHSLLRTPAAGQGSLLLGNGSFGSGGSRKLRINRELNTQPDLFGERSTPKPLESAKEQDGLPRNKRVSFDHSAESSTGRASAANSIVPREDESTTSDGTPETPKVNGNGLDSVPEESAAPQQNSTSSPRSGKPVEPGEYFTIPSIEELKHMPRNQLERMDKFVVGRHNVGRIVFGRTGPVNLTEVSHDEICGDVVRLLPRNATVYQDNENKPSVGHGLNVPSTISLEQSWPRSTRLSGVAPSGKSAAFAAKELEAHKRRLARIRGTTFQDYDPDTGVWTFTVEHFTTYALDDSDDEEDMDEDTGVLDLQPKIPSSMRTASSGLSEPPAAGEVSQQSFSSGLSEIDSPDLGEQDDTFEFKLARRSQQSNISIPGGFGGDDNMELIAHDRDETSADEMQEDERVTSRGMGQPEMEDPFIEAGAVQPPSPSAMERYHSSLMEGEETDEADEDEQDVPGSFRAEPAPPKSILKPSVSMPSFASPEKVAEMPWEEQLQRTISPKKRDRQALRDMQASLALKQPETGAGESPFKKSLFSRSQLGQSHLATKSAKKGASSEGASTTGRDSALGKSQAFTTGMDLINSLWGEPQKGTKTKGAFGEIQHPSKRQRLSDINMNEHDASLHNNLKPSFDGQNTLVYSMPGSAKQVSREMRQNIKPIVGEHKDVRFAHFIAPEGFDGPALQLQKDHSGTTGMHDHLDVPRAIAPKSVPLAAFAELDGGESAVATEEKAIWRLCSALFDPLETCANDLLFGIPGDQIGEYEQRIRLDCFQSFWTKLIEPDVDAKTNQIKSNEEKALLLLTKGSIIEACKVLTDAGNVRLATLVSQLPGCEVSREVMRQQIEGWKQRKDWSEFSDAVKALYTVLAGQTCTVTGVNGASEDRTREFCLSERFGLGWREAFALRVQYGGHESLHDAVTAYVADLDADKEKVKPRPWHFSGKEEEKAKGKDEDTLLGFLRLFAAGDIDVTRLFHPTTVSGSALNSRVAWQLATVLSEKEVCWLQDENLDTLTFDFASQLEAAGDWKKAAWVMLHITEQGSRNGAVKALLERNAASLPSPADDHVTTADTWALPNLSIPSSLVWAAKALYAHAVLREPALQAEWLLNTESEDSFSEAHNVLCQIVGPHAVIEQDYHDLAGLLEQFHAKGGQDAFLGWKTGGKVYASFLALLNLTRAQKQEREGRNACFALSQSLKDVDREGLMNNSLEVRVAILEMKRVLADVQREIRREVTRPEADTGSKGNVGSMLDSYRRALGVV